MFLVQLLLPTRNPSGGPIPTAAFAAVRHELTDRFGGVTAYLRGPASGLWKRDDGTVEGDEVVMVEVVAESLDREWWGRYRAALEREFQQESILIRANQIETL
jgi:hypothetical protein